ncbi:hypothetical protein GGI25_005437 [Coemansia spiralis]|uniref:Small ribosomal subunit protein bS18m n=2 Tax=Coemansia TaxID=4863 RepID=A0A9W8KVR3_9FUNG|nr:hypothetical protein EDC05_005404 [Coemansia umbellata]KAJ2671620.1 hypothetical protein GGI25_005437 [Coemansia spiralis]
MLATGSDSSASKKEALRAQIDRAIEPLANGPEKVFENAKFSKLFFPKTIYHPAELSEGNSSRYFPKSLDETTSDKDAFLSLGINPIKHYKNLHLLTQFVSDMGKIRPRYKTGLSAKSQRRVAKAIKRARAFGLLPLTSKPNHMYDYKSLGRNQNYPIE